VAQTGSFIALFPYAEFCYTCPVALDVLVREIIKQTAAAADHFE
jgi:hypothetical protein